MIATEILISIAVIMRVQMERSIHYNNDLHRLLRLLRYNFSFGMKISPRSTAVPPFM